MTDSKSRHIPGIFFILLMSALLCATYLLIGDKKFFTVTVIEIRGNERITDREVVKRSGIIAGYTSMFFLESRAEENIYRNPWAESVRIEKIFPDRVIITIEEAEPFSLKIDETNIAYYISEDGRKRGKAEAKYGLDFPIIRTEGKVKQKLLNEAVRVLNLTKTSAILGWDDISEIRVSNRHGLKIFTNSRTVIDFGTGNTLSKWQRIEKIISFSSGFNLHEQYINVTTEGVGVIDYNI